MLFKCCDENIGAVNVIGNEQMTKENARGSGEIGQSGRVDGVIGIWND